MPTFEYIALDPGGKSQKGTISAESPAAARRQLRNRQLHATKVRAISDAAHAGRFELAKIVGGGRRRRLVSEFTQQLATLIDANVQLTESLEVMISQKSDPKFTQILQNVRDQVLSGESLADCLKDYPGWFDPIYVAMVRVGEVTGHLGNTLKLLSGYITKRMRVEGKIKSALTYPIILIVVFLVATLVLMLFLVPRITKLLTQTGREVPALTSGVMAASQFLINYWWLILVALAAGWYGLDRLRATTKGKMMFDKFLLRLPLFGEILRQGIVARFTSTLGALVRSGLPVAEALQVVADVIGNAVMTQALHLARERIIAGADIATPLRESGVVGATVSHMISVGERTGELEGMLISVAENIEETTELRINRLTAVIEPVIILCMAVVLAVIVLATLLPVFELTEAGFG